MYHHKILILLIYDMNLYNYFNVIQLPQIRTHDFDPVSHMDSSVTHCMFTKESTVALIHYVHLGKH